MGATTSGLFNHPKRSIPDPTRVEYKPIVRGKYGQNLREKTQEWIKRNPAIYRLFERFALQMADAGMKFGIGLIAERVRWEHYLTYGNEKFKICNSYRAYIARQLVADHPRLKHFMRFRKTRF